ncbi:MAG: polysaccharide deacetylase family protein [Bacteroidota bacterium]
MRLFIHALLPLLLVGASLSTTGCQPTAQPPGPGVPPAPVGKQAQPAATADEFWTAALQEVYKSPLELQAQHETEIAKGLHYRKLMHGDPASRQIAITFDDGPHPQYTPKLLSILDQYHAKATFFLVGEKAEAAPDLVKAEVAAGHSVGNHTYHHVNLTKIPERLVATEILACGNVLKSITGTDAHLFRPPGGDYNSLVAETANGLDYTIVLWTDDPGDYASPGKRVIEQRTLDNLSPGGIILIHDGVQQTVDILPQLLQSLKDRGFECVTIDEMMKGKCNEGSRAISAQGR